MMEISEPGLALIRQFEGCRLAAYPDPASGGAPWTIGYGHTRDVRAGDRCTEAEAEAWLADDVQFAVAAVNRLVKVRLEPHQFNPLVSFTYNLGQGALGSSTLLRLLNAGNFNAVPAQFLRWDKGPDGQPLPGLTRRRQAEAAMFKGEGT